MKFIIVLIVCTTASLTFLETAASIESILINPDNSVVVPPHKSFYSFPQVQITNTPFRISIFEMSVRNADIYMKSQGAKVSLYTDEQTYLDEPYGNVSFDEAQAICNYYGGRLPSEAEWILAASIKSATSECYESLKYGAFYPYTTGIFPIKQGSTLEACLQGQDDEFVAESAGSELDDVKHSIENINGTYGMLGSVWEWVDAERSYFGKTYKVIKGGSFVNSKQPELYDSRLSNFMPADTRISTIGFRCAWDVEKESQ